jgi:spectinomycin phosphotransferase
MRERPDISEELLRACLQEHYRLSTVTLDFLPLGQDYNAGVYRVVGEQGVPYLLKATSRSLSEASYLVPGYLRDQSIASVVAPLPTTSQTLWSQAGTWTVIVYPFIDGETGWTTMTDDHWREAGRTFRRIHQLTPPAHVFEKLHKESFDPAEYARRVQILETQHIPSQHGESASECAVRTSWVAHQSTIRTAVAMLEKLAEVLQKQSGPYVICHADLHPGNMIRDHAGHIHVIDWDEVMLAPKERDFLFTGEPPANGLAGSSVPPFFQGYEQTEIDWIALTYYLYERVVQDLIEYAQTVFLRDDLGEESKSDNAQAFHDIVTENIRSGNASAAASHLPAELAIDISR